PRPARGGSGAVLEEHRDTTHDEGGAPGGGTCIGEAEDWHDHPADLGGRHSLEAPWQGRQPGLTVVAEVRCIARRNPASVGVAPVPDPLRVVALPGHL